jgi:4-hydroxy-tetrahydrodipicolinate synthase
MLTPFTENNKIDYKGLEALIEWYVERGVHGLFAVCQSSEMFYISLDERVELARFVVAKAAGRVPVIASGHTGDTMEEQLEEIRQISATGITAFVLVSNRLARQDEGEVVWKAHAETILKQIPDVNFGVYECPYPYKRLLSPELLRWCSDTGRFMFLKDTCCDPELLNRKLEAVRGSRLKIFNANSATLLHSLRMGAAGFSGVMANFHPELYVWLTNHWNSDPERAERLQSFLGPASLIELHNYPANAKRYLRMNGVMLEPYCRVNTHSPAQPQERLLLEQVKRLSEIHHV